VRLPCPQLSQARRLGELISSSAKPVKSLWAAAEGKLSQAGGSAHPHDQTLLGNSNLPCRGSCTGLVALTASARPARTALPPPFRGTQNCAVDLHQGRIFVPSVTDRGLTDKVQSICIPKRTCMVPLWIFLTWVSFCERKNTGFTKKTQRFVFNTTKCLST